MDSNGMNSNEKPCLSPRVLDMTFSQRTKANVEKQEKAEQSQALYANFRSNFIVEHSYSRCEGLIDGRLSFGGMNPELELLMEQEQEEKRKLMEQEQEKKRKLSKPEEPKEESSMAQKFSSRKVFKRQQPKDDQASNSEPQAKKKQEFKEPREDED